MAVRTYPTKKFGNVPQLDKHITRGQKETPHARFYVGETPFPNLTLARFEVMDRYSIEAEDFSSLTEYDANGMGRKKGFVVERKIETTKYMFTVEKGDVKISVACTSVEEVAKLIKAFLNN